MGGRKRSFVKRSFVEQRLVKDRLGSVELNSVFFLKENREKTHTHPHKQCHCFGFKWLQLNLKRQLWFSTKTSPVLGRLPSLHLSAFPHELHHKYIQRLPDKGHISHRCMSKTKPSSVCKPRFTQSSHTRHRKHINNNNNVFILVIHNNICVGEGFEPAIPRSLDNRLVTFELYHQPTLCHPPHSVSPVGNRQRV